MVLFPSVELLESQQLLSELFDNSSVGLAVFNHSCQYRIVNPYLAASNCTPIESHLGKHVREILGEKIGFLVEAAIRKVLATGKPVLNCELEGALPTKPYGCWIDNFFPISDSNGGVSQVGVVVVELERKVEIATMEAQSMTAPTILRSWKDISRHLGTCVKTAQRWERTNDLPVHRVQPNKGSVVFALKDELDNWLRTRKSGI